MINSVPNPKGTASPLSDMQGINVPKNAEKKSRDEDRGCLHRPPDAIYPVPTHRPGKPLQHFVYSRGRTLAGALGEAGWGRTLAVAPGW